MKVPVDVIVLLTCLICASLLSCKGPSVALKQALPGIIDRLNFQDLDTRVRTDRICFPSADLRVLTKP
jgi:hypothetical protein